MIAAIIGALVAFSAVDALRISTSSKPLINTRLNAEPLVSEAWNEVANIDQIPDSFVKPSEAPNSMRRRFEQLLRKAQLDICAAIEEADGEAKFRPDPWVREGGGGGITRVLSGGKVWEKAGINLSVVYGNMPKATLDMAAARGADRAKGSVGDKVPFFACGLSSVMHPRNPHCPTMHFNYRYFETDAGVWWFGGGTDITPFYLDREDVTNFHSTYKKACDKHDPSFYPKFKKWADEYYHITHRGETRGVGGIFFDDLNDREPEKLYEFCKTCLENVAPAYVPIINKHKNDPFTEEEKKWQLIRRGRYAEFNIIYDRGTIFGLKNGGRIESIMMSLPEIARWEYDHKPVPGSREDEILQIFKKPVDWV
eukprot:gene981-1066_t